jgi:hypothetical protein
MGGVHKAAQPQKIATGGASLSIAMSLSSGLGVGNNIAQAFAGPNGAQAFAGNPAGGFGSLNSCGCGNHTNALAGNFGAQNPFGPQNGAQNPFQAGFQQGMQASKMQKLMKKMKRLQAKMAQLGGFPGGPQMAGAPGGAFASAGPNGAFASAGIPPMGMPNRMF